MLEFEIDNDSTKNSYSNSKVGPSGPDLRSIAVDRSNWIYESQSTSRLWFRRLYNSMSRTKWSAALIVTIELGDSFGRPSLARRWQVQRDGVKRSARPYGLE